MTDDKNPPAALHPKVVATLLDRLSDENEKEFRELFQRDPQAALVEAGYTEPGACLQLKDGATLASPEKIRAERQRLEQSLSSIFGFTFDCPSGLSTSA